MSTSEKAAPQRRLGDSLLAKAAGLRRGPPQSDALLRVIGKATPTGVLTAAVLGGVSGTDAMVVLTLAAQHSGNAAALLPLVLLSLLFLFGYRMADRAVMEMGPTAMQATLHRTCNRIAGKVSRLDIRDIETLSREEMAGPIGSGYATISNAAIPVLPAIQSTVMPALVLAYIIWLSPAALLLGLIAAALIVAAPSVRSYLTEQQALQDAMAKTVAAEATLLGTVGEMLGSFKESRLDQIKRREILAELRRSSQAPTLPRARTAGVFAELIVAAQSTQYFLAEVVVLALPVLGLGQAADTRIMLSTAHFLMGPLGNFVGTTPQIAALPLAVQRVQAFEERVDRLLSNQPTASSAPSQLVTSVREAQSIGLRAVSYAHSGSDKQHGFHVGPLDFRIGGGDVVTITGSNVTGKATALRLITGLYPPNDGQLLLNGSSLRPIDLEAHRHLFGTAFSDFSQASLGSAPSAGSSSPVSSVQQQVPHPEPGTSTQ